MRNGLDDLDPEILGSLTEERIVDMTSDVLFNLLQKKDFDRYDPTSRQILKDGIKEATERARIPERPLTEEECKRMWAYIDMSG